jgi:DNA-binding LacI/PurR family transcriptional regulator
VLKAIEDLGFRPNRAAQSLVTRRSRILQVVTFGTTYYGPSQMVAHVEHEAKALDYNLIFSSIAELTVSELRKAIDNPIGTLEGIIMIAPIWGANYEELCLLFRGTPCVWIGVEQGVHIPSVVIDQAHGSRLATQHLIELGHRQFAQISGPLNWVDALERARGWHETLQSAGIEPGVSIEGDWTAAGGYLAVQRLLESNAPFTALVVGNDQMALGAIHALDEHGLRVPEDISVVGFDDVPEAAHFKAPLTTVRQDFSAMGKQGVDYLVSLINKPDTPPHQRVLLPHLVVRSSTQRRR